MWKLGSSREFYFRWYVKAFQQQQKKAARFSLCHMIVNWVNELKTTVYSCQLFSLFTSIHFRSQSLRTLVWANSPTFAKNTQTLVDSGRLKVEAILVVLLSIQLNEAEQWPFARRHYQWWGFIEVESPDGHIPYLSFSHQKERKTANLLKTQENFLFSSQLNADRLKNRASDRCCGWGTFIVHIQCIIMVNGGTQPLFLFHQEHSRMQFPRTKTMHFIHKVIHAVSWERDVSRLVRYKLFAACKQYYIVKCASMQMWIFFCPA